MPTTIHVFQIQGTAVPGSPLETEGNPPRVRDFAACVLANAIGQSTFDEWDHSESLEGREKRIEKLVDMATPISDARR